jgi:hypothetical protein
MSMDPKSPERLLGEIHANVTNMQQTLTQALEENRQTHKELYQKLNEQKSDFDKLKTEHNERSKNGDCSVTVKPGNREVNVASYRSMPASELSKIIGGTSGVTLVLFIIILILLYRFGIIGS